MSPTPNSTASTTTTRRMTETGLALVIIYAALFFTVVFAALISMLVNYCVQRRNLRKRTVYENNDFDDDAADIAPHSRTGSSSSGTSSNRAGSGPRDLRIDVELANRGLKAARASVQAYRGDGDDAEPTVVLEQDGDVSALRLPTPLLAHLGRP
ncbi:hypothetical protein M011DRAFT_481786 [Sporormia fimetaria CBS 119925]|uniref:Uncharacterized protein n=1 Tax=Sporormia fimetaria CBS 119925 TaxID=1340428 RepID=A0A6A6UVK2_9PLEO|nr:hypothetical protein M011DRAFT_481786 [Sporormia fimetaria CBS 119925]